MWQIIQWASPNPATVLFGSTGSTVSSFHTVFPSRSLLEEEKEINAKTPFFYGFGL